MSIRPVLVTSTFIPLNGVKVRKETRRQMRTDYTITDRKRERESNFIVVICSQDTFKLVMSVSGNKKCIREIFDINNYVCTVSVFQAVIRYACRL
jgi:hypothetical protein